MFDTHKLEFDIYYCQYENEVIASLLDIVLDNHIVIHKMTKTGPVIYHYVVTFKGITRTKLQSLVSTFIHKCGDKMNHISFK